MVLDAFCVLLCRLGGHANGLQYALYFPIHRLVFFPDHTRAELCRHLRFVVLAEPVRQKIFQCHVFLQHQPATRELAGIGCAAADITAAPA